ncbi:MAG: DUF4190 domain-containing protein, partial [Tepidisphaeraceae bacterium]
RETPREQARVEAYRQWFVRQHPLALASAVLSVFSLTHLGTLWVDELAGIALGVLAIRAARRQPERSVRIAYVGIAVGVVSLICAIVIYTRPAG